MSQDESYLWIKTRDGSPTLWSNEVSEPFRSTKGAFSESWAAFVRPAIVAARVRSLGTEAQPVHVGEFGLGPGTNWIIWSVAARLLGMSYHYDVIEKHPEFFYAGLAKWRSMAGGVVDFVAEAIRADLGEAPRADLTAVTEELASGRFDSPRIYASLVDAVPPVSADPVDVWFHDPFGLSVNPDGYSPETIAICHRMWSPAVAGFSYAVNRPFRQSLESLGTGMTLLSVATGGKGSLKRSRSEFYGPLYPSVSALK